MFNRIKILASVGLFLLSLLSPATVLAASNVIYVSPSSTTINQGSNFSIEIRIDPNTSINAVQADLSYNSSIVQFDSLSLGAFTLCAQQSGGGGLIQVSCSTTSSVNTDSLIATVNFTALNGGTSSLSLSNYNAVNPSTSAYTNPSAQNGSVTVNGVAPSTSPSNNSPRRYNYYTSPNNIAPNPVSPITPSTPAVPIKISSTSLHFYFSTGQIIISCNENVTGSLKFGTNPKNLIGQINGSSNSSTETFNLNPSNLIPGTKYYYQILLNGSNGATYTSPLKSFQTKGLSVALLVLGSNDKNVSNLKVFIDNSKTSFRTNSKGILNLVNMTPGNHKISYYFNNKTYSSSFYVQNLVITSGINYQISKPQNLAVILTSYNQKSNYVWFWIIITTVLLLTILAYILSKVIKINNLIKIFELHKDLRVNGPRI